MSSIQRHRSDPGHRNSGDSELTNGSAIAGRRFSVLVAGFAGVTRPVHRRGVCDGDDRGAVELIDDVVGMAARAGDGYGYFRRAVVEVGAGSGRGFGLVE
ncbi:hypothetical protein [Micromonospora wenchangensis]|uniref:hypothetical protein n=1 Tax=Micromonospora wenchangensis TaxID=1185415 RepID=UPI003D73954E